jgi:hypothetical protein
VVAEPLDQPTWQALTTWDGDDLTFSHAWAIMSSADLPKTFQDVVGGSRHPFVQQLRRVPVGAVRSLERQKRWNNRFANLVSGRFTEILFSFAYGSMIAACGLNIRPKTDIRDWHDYLIDGDAGRFQLAINVKNAGVQFRQARQFVGLAPEDTLPIATYKIFGSSAREEQLPLVYVYLVDWTLIARLRAAYWSALGEAERRLFRLITTFKGMPRDLEDSFIEATVAERITLLSRSVGYNPSALAELPFRAISGARCKAIFYRNHGRSPYVFLQRMDTDPNVHISVALETLHFSEFVTSWLIDHEKRRALLAGLRHTSPMPVPDPPV